MPDDFVINVRQITQYPNAAYVLADDRLVLQRGGLGGPFISADAATVVATALNAAGPFAVGVAPPLDSVPEQIFTDHGIKIGLDRGFSWNMYRAVDVNRYFANGPSASYNFGLGPTGAYLFSWLVCPPGLTGQPAAQTLVMDLGTDGHLNVSDQVTVAREASAPFEVATWGQMLDADQVLRGELDAQMQAVQAAVMDYLQRTAVDIQELIDQTNANTNALIDWMYRQPRVATFNGRSGDVCLSTLDIVCAGGAPILSPQFVGFPTAPTPPCGDATDRLATTLFVAGTTDAAVRALRRVIDPQIDWLALQTDWLHKYAAGICSPRLQGCPTAPTPPIGNYSDRLATTRWVTWGLDDLHDDVTDERRASERRLFVKILGAIPSGPQGAAGPAGPPGAGLEVKGTVTDPSELPTSGNSIGDLWVISPGGEGYLWVGEPPDWLALGPVQGPPGPMGPQGPFGPPGVQGVQGPPGFGLTIGGTAPANPATDPVWYDDTTGTFNVWNGTTWQQFLPLTGGTLTGDLGLTGATPDILFNSTTGYESGISWKLNGVNRWRILPFRTLAANFAIQWDDDAGVYQGDALTIVRANGDALVHHDPTQPLGIATKQYVDQVAQIGYLPLTGGTLTGPLTITPSAGGWALTTNGALQVNGTAYFPQQIAVEKITPYHYPADPLPVFGWVILENGDPTDPLGAVTKQYCDNTIANAIAAIPPPVVTGYLPLTGGTLTGLLSGPDGSFTRFWVGSNGLSVMGPANLSNVTSYGGPNSNLPINGYAILNHDPAVAMGAATKQYVDNAIAAIPPPVLTGYLPLSGGTMTGELTIGTNTTPIINSYGLNIAYAGNWGGIAVIQAGASAGPPIYASGYSNTPTIGAIQVQQNNSGPGIMIVHAVAASCAGLLIQRGSFVVNPSLLLTPQTSSLANDVVLGDIYFGNAVGTGAINNQRGAAIVATATQTWAAGSAGAKLTFRTTANSTVTPQVRMTIDHSGEVTVAQDPTLGLGVATKQYVDSRLGVTFAASAPPAPFEGQFWWDTALGGLRIYAQGGWHGFAQTPIP